MPKLNGESPIATSRPRMPANALRKALIASVAFGFLASLASPANARYRDRDRDDDDDAPRIKRSATNKQDGKKQDPKAEKKADPFAEAAKGQMQLVVSIGSQRVTLYSNGQRMTQGPVSTGVPGHPTPMGVFSIIEKDRYHHSNIYSGAPMPYMQRITWSGVALHEGALPGGPASHGCIRMSHDFAARLWPITKLGIRVVVARTEVTPVEFSHPSLFVPKPKPVEPPPVASQEPPKEAARPAAIQIAAVGAGAGAGDTPTNVGLRSTVAETTPQAATSGTPAVFPLATGSTFDNNAPSIEPAQPAVDEIPPPLPKASPIRMRGEPRKPSGHVAVFVSRKEKKIYVRQGFTPLFDAPIEITDSDRPLGTHVFTALELQDNGTKIRWNVMTMPPEQPRAEPRRDRDRDRRSQPPKPMVTEVKPPPSTAKDALERIQIPHETIDRINEIIGAGSSLVISDQGLGQETGKGTDFVVVTR